MFQSENCTEKFKLNYNKSSLITASGALEKNLGLLRLCNKIEWNEFQFYCLQYWTQKGKNCENKNFVNQVFANGKGYDW